MDDASILLCLVLFHPYCIFVLLHNLEFSPFIYIQVSSHGYVTFNGRSAYLTPVSFPFDNPLLSVICPFWANVDQRISGTTYYRSISSSSQIDTEIRRYFSYAKDFTTTWALVATWDKVGYYNRHADKASVNYNNMYYIRIHYHNVG